MTLLYNSFKLITCLILGINVAWIFPYYIYLILISSLLILGTIKDIEKKFLIVFFMLGSMSYSVKNYEISLFEQIVSNKNINIIGSVEKISHEQNNFIKQSAIIKALQLTVENNTLVYPFLFEIKLTKKEPIEIGNIINIANISVPLKTFKQNSFKEFLKKEHIAFSITLSNIDYAILHKPYFSLKKFFYSLQEKICTTLNKKMDQQTYNLFMGMFLGHKASLQEYDYKNQFSFWGISHYLARSGIHMVVVALFIQLLFKPIPIPNRIKRLFQLILYFLYNILTWNSISFTRAFSLSLLITYAHIHHKFFNYLYLLLIVTLITLLYNPFHLFFLDFQLSFLLTAGLSWFSSLLYNKKI